MSLFDEIELDDEQAEFIQAQIRKAKEEGRRDGEQRAAQNFFAGIGRAVVEKSLPSLLPVTVKAEEPAAEPAERDPSPQSALLLAALDHRIHQLESGADDDGGEHLLALFDDPDALSSLLHGAPSGPVLKAFDESKHPRDHGRFASLPSHEDPEILEGENKLHSLHLARAAHLDAEADKGDKAHAASLAAGTSPDHPHLVELRERVAAVRAAAQGRRDEAARILSDRAKRKAAYELGYGKKAYEYIEKAWDSNLHPRDDAGRFVSREAIHAAKTDPKIAEHLRERVTDPTERKKLDAAIAGKTDTGRTAAGLRREASAATRRRKESNRKEAREVASNILNGRGSEPEHLKRLAELIQSGDMRVDELRNIRLKLAASFGGGRRMKEMVAALLDHVNERAKPLSEPEPSPLHEDEKPDADEPAAPADSIASRKADAALESVSDAIKSNASVGELSKLYGRALAANAGLPAAERDAHLAKLRALFPAEDTSPSRGASHADVDDEPEPASAAVPSGPLLTDADRAVLEKRRAKKAAPKAAAPVAEVAVPEPVSAPASEPARAAEAEPEQPSREVAAQQEPWQMTRAESVARASGEEGWKYRQQLPKGEKSPELQAAEQARSEAHDVADRAGAFNGNNNAKAKRLLADYNAAASRADELQGQWHATTNSHDARHRSAVDAALSQGKPVPPAVLADYPDLAAKYGKQPVAESSQSALDTDTPVGNTAAVPPSPAPAPEAAPVNAEQPKPAAPTTPTADDVLAYLREHPKTPLGEVRRALAPDTKFDSTKPLSHPINAALKQLRDEGRVEVHGGDWGEPSFSAKSAAPSPAPKLSERSFAGVADDAAPSDEEFAAAAGGKPASAAPAPTPTPAAPEPQPAAAAVPSAPVSAPAKGKAKAAKVKAAPKQKATKVATGIDATKVAGNNTPVPPASGGSTGEGGRVNASHIEKNGIDKSLLRRIENVTTGDEFRDLKRAIEDNKELADRRELTAKLKDRTGGPGGSAIVDFETGRPDYYDLNDEIGYDSAVDMHNESVAEHRNHINETLLPIINKYLSRESRGDAK